MAVLPSMLQSNSHKPV